MSQSFAQLMDGTELAHKIIEQAAQRAATFSLDTGYAPTLATVLVGDDPASVTYVRMKRKRCERAGLRSVHVGLPATAATAELVDAISTLSADPAVHGILLQHPVGPQIDERAAFDAIDPAKDVDGVTSASFAAMSLGESGFTSCTPGGIMRLLDHYRVDPTGLHAVVVGRSPILGKPVGMLLLGRNATVTYCHSHTLRLSEIVREADLIVAAVGKPRFIHGENIKPRAVVIDAGYNPGNIGDVDFDSARSRARLITPVPGGVGPMTVATLIDQTVKPKLRRPR